MIDLRLPTGSPTTSTTRLPLSLPLPAHPPPALSPAPNPPGGRPVRRAELRRRPRGPALLRRSERRSCRRGCACPAPALAPPACRRARSFRGRHALGRAGTAPSCHRPVGPPGLSCCARPAPCSCATPPCASRGADRDLRVGENEHLLLASTWAVVGLLTLGHGNVYGQGWDEG